MDAFSAASIMKSGSDHNILGTFATRLLNNGVNPRTVADLLGYTDLTMVMRYMVPPDELKRSAVDALVMAQKPMFC